MLDLAAPTPRAWVDQALADMDTILIDHAHCEKKAASTAIGLLFRYADDVGLMAPLSALAREELDHFEQVLTLLAQRGVPFGKLVASPYAGRLYEHVRRDEPNRLLDTLLASALIEARSCERMKLLADNLADPVLAAFYTGLLACEARHFHGYVELAGQRFDRDVVRKRLHELADAEAAVLREPSELRMHSGVA